MKRLGLLAGVFVLLVLVLVVQQYQRRKIVVAGPAETIQVDPEKVTRVVIQTPDGPVELERTGSEWKLTKPVEYPANGDLVKGMLQAIQELKLVDVISSRPENRATYQVDSTGTTVEAWTGDQKAGFHDTEQCVSVCPTDAIKKNPNLPETREQLLEKVKGLHPDKTF